MDAEKLPRCAGACEVSVVYFTGKELATRFKHRGWVEYEWVVPVGLGRWKVVFEFGGGTYDCSRWR